MYKSFLRYHVAAGVPLEESKQLAQQDVDNYLQTGIKNLNP